MEHVPTFSPLLDAHIPLYMQVYTYYKELITNGKLPPKTRLPSIRRCAQALSVSRTTAESAYLQLCADGYILSKPQSGYYVTDLYFHAPQTKPAAAKTHDPKIRYDFSSLSADRESFDFDLWRRYLKSALRQDERLLSYGEVQGEQDLREAVAQYVTEARGAVCTPERIVIGAGVQSLLHILCAVLGSGQSIAFRDKAFMQGIAIFRDHGFTICEDEAKAQLLYTSPSHMNRRGDIMSTPERIELLRSANARGATLIEDDYDNEFGYFSRSSPALQGLDGGRSVIYIGTFSKLLLPSIRLSFMILPDALIPRYRKIAPLYNQTASKTEQIALCRFIRDGRLTGQIRKIRRLYIQKTLYVKQIAERVFGDAVRTEVSETGFVVKAHLQTALSAEAVQLAAAKAGVAVYAERAADGVTLLLSGSGVPKDEVGKALEILRQICQIPANESARGVCESVLN